MGRRLQARVAGMRARIGKWLGRKDRARGTDRVEFMEVFDRVLEESDWVWLRAAALERSWRADGAQVD